ncbi:1-(5-phosphoribosyl)-5-[(5-phosphoribosylamino)methylideneamino] imidazole-4-carboxamide isomerase [Caulifigura coniformis]|uniref:1-(5-phosphoribosyl)-5-[(5-phosphoribosylamino)methylideneamino] imidazole-4-carboxamide isomerase n=1 Tax=Caulifigura coniformis TaxID=2527983 RepID=A0A517S9M9_9PLAN|nr:1-(5-phosphoribosyl)-5-[(5-phosphoribosylamino)methylideneamino]imidazole-4-carboxamide isomerase [Caulifigura coniformis]QDT52823.1 1-(5-phosphoribosyl)-5-[(5-phosphoribosylamino)methylideneamino] imidazole-4-carboxamide isomerase [Caulifigura coniformis]
MEILPAIDLRGGRCVRLRQGDYNQETVFSDDPAAQAKQWVAGGATRLHLVDLDGAKAGKPVNIDAIRSIVQAVDVPCQVGGGIRDDDAVKLLLNDIGVERVIIGTQALKQPAWYIRLLEQYPGKAVLGLDARDGFVATAGWLEVSHVAATDLIRQFVDYNLQTVIYTNIANDGMMQGIDDGTLADLAKMSELGPEVIASGGVTSLKDIERLVTIQKDHPKLVGVIVGRALYERAFTIEQAIATTPRPGNAAG